MARWRPQLVLAALVLAGAGAGAAAGHTSSARSKQNDSISRVDPIFGVVHPSQDIKDFLASVARKNSKESKKNETEVEKDSGEDLRPKNSSNHANMGFELYWPGGEWVNRKAAIDYCNTSESACPVVYKRYGKVCAGSVDLRAQHTFDNVCEMEETNCRDGTASFMTISNYASTVRWFRVNRNSSLVFKLSVPGVMHVTFTRGRSLKYQPQFTFFFGGGNSGYDMDLKRDAYDTSYLEYATFWPTAYWYVSKRRIRTFRAQWNEDEGYVTWTFLDENHQGYRDQKATLPSYWKYRDERKFPVRYVGVWGGSSEEPHWYELTGLARGYLMAYRGRCRENLPTLPPDAPKRMGDRHKIQLFNFAERMDVFGYNFSRINGTIPSDYGGDYFSDYHALP